MYLLSRRTVGAASLLAAAISVAGLAGGIAQAAPTLTAPASGSAVGAAFTPTGCDYSIVSPELVDKYNGAGGKDVLGCPTINERETSDHRARYVNFQDSRGIESAIYSTDLFTHASVFLITDQSPVPRHGILTKWRNSGPDGGRYKYPTQDAVSVGGGYSTQQFQGGSLDNF
ncbi:hypothetical protein R3Q06_29915 [Rhodococcus erythropolis]|uniref:LGFP repeat-containing protein n=1 Tax=Rhodococcus erythropolis TaxID=1833 RepID=UPI002949563D|nr:hypothetical protein [Rhodococcus erythropolis]MDV6277714.1 hypothetical protein [Rhodococcus erythropolis]